MNASPELELTVQGGTPIHRQIQDQLRSWILSGLLYPGEQLPTLRALAVGLAINPTSVARAYARLEREGFLTTEDDSGTFVAELPRVRTAAAGRQTRLERFCARLLDQADRRGFSSEELLCTLQALTQRRSQS